MLVSHADEHPYKESGLLFCELICAAAGRSLIWN
jgi:hypothetical protein